MGSCPGGCDPISGDDDAILGTAEEVVAAAVGGIGDDDCPPDSSRVEDYTVVLVIYILLSCVNL